MASEKNLPKENPPRLPPSWRRAAAGDVCAAGHLLLHGRAVLRGGLRDARDHESKREGGGFDRRGFGHGSTFSIGLGWKFESAQNLVQSRIAVDPMFMVIGRRY